MEDIFPTQLIDLLTIAVTLSMVVMALLQKFKSLPFIKKSFYIWFLNLIFSFSIAIPFTEKFYHLPYKDGIWVGFFTFIGAPTIYSALKNQTILRYKPSSISDTVHLSIKNEIKRV